MAETRPHKMYRRNPLRVDQAASHAPDCWCRTERRGCWVHDPDEHNDSCWMCRGDGNRCNAGRSDERHDFKDGGCVICKKPETVDVIIHRVDGGSNG